MSNHTPGTLSLSKNGAAYNVSSPDRASHHMILIGMSGQPEGEHEANANRMRDCWNACEGINPEAVPDLLQALEILLKECQCYVSDNPISMVPIQVAHSAIAKAKGESL